MMTKDTTPMKLSSVDIAIDQDLSLKLPTIDISILKYRLIHMIINFCISYTLNTIN